MSFKSSADEIERNHFGDSSLQELFICTLVLGHRSGLLGSAAEMSNRLDSSEPLRVAFIIPQSCSDGQDYP